MKAVGFVVEEAWLVGHSEKLGLLTSTSFLNYYALKQEKLT